MKITILIYYQKIEDRIAKKLLSMERLSIMEKRILNYIVSKGYRAKMNKVHLENICSMLSSLGEKTRPNNNDLLLVIMLFKKCPEKCTELMNKGKWIPPLDNIEKILKNPDSYHVIDNQSFMLDDTRLLLSIIKFVGFYTDNEHYFNRCVSIINDLSVSSSEISKLIAALYVISLNSHFRGRIIVNKPKRFNIMLIFDNGFQNPKIVAIFMKKYSLFAISYNMKHNNEFSGLYLAYALQLYGDIGSSIVFFSIINQSLQVENIIGESDIYNLEIRIGRIDRILYYLRLINHDIDNEIESLCAMVSGLSDAYYFDGCQFVQVKILDWLIENNFVKNIKDFPIEHRWIAKRIRNSRLEKHNARFLNHLMEFYKHGPELYQHEFEVED